jgi:hypothetical protein
VVAISAGLDHSLALRADGTVVGWGGNAARVPADLYGVVAVAAGFNSSLALKSDGSVWGAPAPWTNVVAIAAGLEGYLGLSGDGTVLVFSDFPGGPIPSGLSNIVAVSLSGAFGLCLRSDGTVAGAGVPPGLSNIVAIAAGGSFGMGSLALKNDGTVQGWGGSVVVPDNLSGVSAIAAGGFGLVITTNPPQPLLSASIGLGGSVSIRASVSVSGYVLQSSDGGSFSDVPAYTNSFTFTNAADPGFQLPIVGPSKFFRLRKQ